MRAALSAHGAAKGLALGRVRLRLPQAFAVPERRIGAGEVADELARLARAMDATRQALHDQRSRLQGALARELGEFLDLHALILDDPELRHGLEALVRDGRYAAEYALKLQRDRVAAVFEAMDDDYFRSRLEDLDHVVGRLRAALHRGEASEAPEGLAGEVLISDAIGPAELAQLQARGVVAVVTTGGSVLSHSAILARSLHLPLVVGAGDALALADDGDVVIVDGERGEVVLRPDAADLEAHALRREVLAAEHRRLQRLRGRATRSRDGEALRLHANAESAEDVAEAHALGADGIGLYRTEFLFLRRSEPPGEDEQFEVYRDLALAMPGRPVVLRTLDLGADKVDAGGIVQRGEPNPALGLRGVRLSLARGALFEAQLRAMLRASAFGDVRVLVPMVARREELLAVRGLLARLRDDLRAEGHAMAASVPLGAMIEVPAAALALPAIGDLVDFLSIGTNDLVQYVLAADRDNEALGDLYSPMHPAVLRLLKEVIAFGARRGLPVSVCGEVAGDPLLAPALLALGLRDFSLHPSGLLALRDRLGGLECAALRRRAPGLLRCPDQAGIARWLGRA
jgi:phosphotransferase system enzyme I (PtsI)